MSEISYNHEFYFAYFSVNLRFEIIWNDPVQFSFAHGSKDGVPFPIDWNTFDSSIKFLSEAIEVEQLSWDEKGSALNRLSANLKIIFPGYSH